MPKNLNYMQQYLIEEFIEEYTEGHISRRDMLRRILAVTGSIATTATVLVACGPQTAGNAPTTTSTTPTKSAASAPAATANPTPTQVMAASPTPAAATTPTAAGSATGTPAAGVSVPENDPDIQTAMISIDRGSFQLKCYLARPRNATPVPGVIVIHENRGLTPYIKDVARRAAKAGFAALAPDLVSRKGGTDQYPDSTQVTGILGQANPEELTSDLSAATDYLQSQSFVKPGGIGTVGFCMGGGYVWRLAMTNQKIKAAVPFYGPVPPDPKPLAQSNAAFLIILGGNDTRVNSTIPNAEAVLKESHKTYEIKTYEGANHAFHNDTGASYKPDAAKDAWDRTIAWFNKYLK